MISLAVLGSLQESWVIFKVEAGLCGAPAGKSGILRPTCILCSTKCSIELWSSIRFSGREG